MHQRVVEAEDDDEDDRHESFAMGSRAGGRRDVGTGSVNHALPGLQGASAKAPLSAAVKKVSPSPFLSGAGMDLSKAAADLGLGQLKAPVKPVKEPKPKKPKVEKPPKPEGG